MISAIVVLVLFTVLLGPNIERLPKNSLRLIVGSLLLVFGMQWLRKAILRASGFKALHDEEKIYREEVATATYAKNVSHFFVSDWYGFTLAFKGVLLEGLEVVFIVVTFGIIQKGSNPHAFTLALVAAISATVLVTVAGFIIHKPLSKIPENSMKFIVGILLTSFGIFWGAEGAGAIWPHADLSLLAITPFVFVTSLILIALLKIRHRRNLPVKPLKIPTFNPPNKNSSQLTRILGGFLFFWYDFIIGDDWRVATAVVIALFGIHSLGADAWWVMPVVVLLSLFFTLLEATRSDGVNVAKPSGTSR